MATLPSKRISGIATAMVRASSSWLHMDRSPWETMAMAGANQPMAWRIAPLSSLRRGMWAP